LPGFSDKGKPHFKVIGKIFSRIILGAEGYGKDKDPSIDFTLNFRGEIYREGRTESPIFGKEGPNLKGNSLFAQDPAQLQTPGSFKGIPPPGTCFLWKNSLGEEKKEQ
jgi:hypothetical protein